MRTAVPGTKVSGPDALVIERGKVGHVVREPLVVLIEAYFEARFDEEASILLDGILCLFAEIHENKKVFGDQGGSREWFLESSVSLSL